jgi:hypothetical protein
MVPMVENIELFIVFSIEVAVGALVGGLLARRSNSPRLVFIAGMLGGALGGFLYFGLYLTVWGPIFQSWPRVRNEIGMGVTLGSVFACGALVAALASLACRDVLRGTPPSRMMGDETPAEAPPFTR